MEPIHLLEFFLKSFRVNSRTSPLRLKRGTHSSTRGFTIIEMVVVLAIITILVSIVLTSQNGFNRTLLLTDTAYTVAFSLRETQSFGLSSVASGGIFNAGYGIHFSSGMPNSYIEFADTQNNSPLASRVTNVTTGWCPTGTPNTPDAKPGDCLYVSGSDAIIRTYTFNQGYLIGSFCAYHGGVPLGCSNNANGLSSLDIVFQRPNTTTVMTAITTNNVALQADTACIDIVTPDGLSNRYVEVTQLGEILVLTGGSCP
jgi:prepilin-type N-terminal cleavage/methylation domain-containing protein